MEVIYYRFFSKYMIWGSCVATMFHLTLINIVCMFSPSQCLKQYVELLIKEGLETAISCPDSACPKRGHLQENEVMMCTVGLTIKVVLRV